ncbi:Phosphoribosylanthranilate isomerase [hydrothermal vent metagenome]|uniref:phosphoribosylanthranilate isomerase n=1 Tax=hydrothermal vent metagenome TaxID=652676 RepID=A0A3B0W0E5_9ZZZZ
MSSRYFTKFCGITNIKDALNAQSLGCDALGFVFVRKSKRYIDPIQCQNIINKLSPAMLTVALFANNSGEEITEILNKCSVHVLQFHGDETPRFCRQWHKPYWKAIPMADKVNPLEYANNYHDAQAYLLDNYGNDSSGGSGSKFDWNNLPQHIDNKWILAGGLHPKNIQQAVQLTGINCFDISSGIEQYAGKKSNKKMKQFLKNLNKAK